MPILVNMFATLYSSSFDYDFFLYSYPRASFSPFSISPKSSDGCSLATKNCTFEFDGSEALGIDSGTYVQDWDDLIKIAMWELESVDWDWQPDTAVAQRSHLHESEDPNDAFHESSVQDTALETQKFQRQRQASSDSEFLYEESSRPCKRLILEAGQGEPCANILHSPISLSSECSMADEPVDSAEQLTAHVIPAISNRSRSCSVDSMDSAQTAVNLPSPSTCSSYSPDTPDSFSKPHRPSLPRTMTMSSCASTLVPSVSSSRVQSPSLESDSSLSHNTMISNLKTKNGNKKGKRTKFSDSRPNPWQCPHCSWIQHTQRMPDFLRHQRSHFTTQEDWPCPDKRCDKSFARKDSLKRHLENSRIQCKRPKGWDVC